MADRSRWQPTAPEPAEPRDAIFSRPREIGDFDFGAETTGVFDDMLERSVPFYAEVERMVGELAADFAAEGTAIYDLGCSTGNTALAIAHRLPVERGVRYIGIDSSQEMLDAARSKLEAGRFPHPFELRRGDLNGPLDLADASVVLLVLTLQFIRPLYRDRLVSRIHGALRERGCLLLVEKVLGESSTLNRLFIKHYYEMKRRNGYSDLEIAQKREALENVLIPYRYEENRELLAHHGFREIDAFFKWYNFCAVIAVK
jgi:tRNA (cmo5U34)-methyltransferase